MSVTTPVLPWCVRALLALVVVTGLGLSWVPAAQADPGNGQGAGPGKGPNSQGPDAEDEELVGAPGTHAAHDAYGYPYPEAPDCDESTLSNGGCVGDVRGFYQGQCTSWVAHRLSQRNGISFSNWYAGRHWGDAVDWAKVAKSMGHKPDKTPSVGAIAWFKRGHVAYVESVNYDGSIVISEMNFDGHNAFRLVTVTPGYGWPDKFIHLADVIPYDATAPSTPGAPKVVTHRGRVGVSWRPSSDAFGVAGYRVLRNGIVLDTTDRTSYWDRRVTSGQAYAYSVVAYDQAGNVSRPATVRVRPGDEDVDRAWVSTSEGPALCGRSGSHHRQRVACTVLTDRGWRTVGTPRTTRWGHAASRAFVATEGGEVSYCRTIGRPRSPGAACTTLDPETLTWGYDRISNRRTSVHLEDSTWLATSSGPALCGRTGTERHQRVSCSVLTTGGWHHESVDRQTRWGRVAGRAFLAGRDGTISYCRALGADPRALRLGCRTFDPDTLSWRADEVSGTRRHALPDDGTWLATAGGPALCGTIVRAGCRVLTGSRWTYAAVRRSAQDGDAASRAFVATRDGDVAWCRTLGDPDGTFRAACSVLDSRKVAWKQDRVSTRDRSTQVANRTWVETSAGPALCGRVGSLDRQRVSCRVLTGRGWRGADLGGALRWGGTQYRAFVPVPKGVGYCRTVGRGVSCTAFDVRTLSWGSNRATTRVARTYADPF